MSKRDCCKFTPACHWDCPNDFECEDCPMQEMCWGFKFKEKEAPTVDEYAGAYWKRELTDAERAAVTKYYQERFGLRWQQDYSKRCLEALKKAYEEPTVLDHAKEVIGERELASTKRGRP